jgi:hypothetical protein
MNIQDGRRNMAVVATIERLLQHGTGLLYVAVRLDEIQRVMTGEYCTTQMAVEAGIDYADRLVLADENRRAEERKAVQL